MNFISRRKIVIATHLYATGPATDLRDFLLSHSVDRLLFLSHPLFYDLKLSGSARHEYRSGTLVSTSQHRLFKLPDTLAYLKDAWLNFWWVLTSFSTWDVYIGSDNLNTLPGVFLRKLGLVKKLVYYVIDYNPHRFANPILNRLYHFIDQFCVTHADATWNLSDRMCEGRLEYFNYSGGHQITVPVGIWLDRIHVKPSSRKSSSTIAFVGHITKKQGLDLVIQSLPQISRHIPNIKLLVIGGGDYLDDLKTLVQKLHLSSKVKFTGFVPNHADIETLISQASAAVAVYDKYVDGQISFTYFADPAKLKLYLACGLPIIVSDVPHNAQLLAAANCAIVVDNTSTSIANAVIKLLSHPRLLKKYQANALIQAAKFDWNVIFTHALNNI